MEKTKACITKLTLETPTFHGISYSPTLLNFGYGVNGAGKSTFCREIPKDTCKKEFAPDYEPGTEMLLLNREFIENCVRPVGGMAKVFSLTVANGKIQKQIEDTQASLEGLLPEKEAIAKEYALCEGDKEYLDSAHISAVMSLTANLRDRYPDASPCFGEAKELASRIEAAQPAHTDAETLDALYGQAYGGDRMNYAPFEMLSPLLVPISPLMMASINRSESSAFARSLEAIGALEWARQGHDLFHKKAGGICPYCQQKLPEGFEALFASSYDALYERDLKGLSSFIEEYSEMLSSLGKAVMRNSTNEYRSSRASDYRDKCLVLLTAIHESSDALAKKKADPGAAIPLPYLGSILSELDEIAAEINGAINGLNQMARSTQDKQRHFGELLLSEMAVLCSEELSGYQERLGAYEERRSGVEEKAASLSTEEDRLKSAIKELKAELHPTDGIMEDINKQLKALGFTGFFLRPSPEVENAYEISRHAGGRVIPAEGLSEGEKNAIAFIYFKSLVYGSPGMGMTPSPKIVIFDDFISSIDSDISFWVATQIRKMIRECLDNDAPLPADTKRPVIRQVFLLTHNVYFYNEIASPFFTDYAHCTCFEIRKDLENKSSIKISEAKSGMDGHSRNIIPVRMRYDSLWRDFLRGTNPRGLLGIARNILEYNFVYHGGYIDGSLRKALLVEHADKFYDPETGDDTDFLIVEELLAAFEVNREGFHDGMYLDLDSLSPDRIRQAVRTVFTAMGQGRHYEWMCEKV